MKDLKWFNQFINNKKQVSSLLIFMLCGILLMLFPSSSKTESTDKGDQSEYPLFSVEQEEHRLEKVLSAIDGVGTCKVLLSVYDSAELILAEDNGETVILSGGGTQSGLVVQTKYPTFQGAVIVCGGCENSSVRYDILSAVVSYTGLGVDRITICPIND